MTAMQTPSGGTTGKPFVIRSQKTTHKEEVRDERAQMSQTAQPGARRKPLRRESS